MVELEDRIADTLLAQARVRDLPLSTYLHHLAEATQPLTVATPLPPDEIDSLIESSAGVFPTLPSTFSRSDIYGDHD